MGTPIYTQQDLYDAANGMIHKKIDNLQDKQETANRAVRHVLGDIDLRSTKRRTALSPYLFTDIFDYACPTDMKSLALIDILPQVNRSQHREFNLTTEEEFDRLKKVDDRLVAFADRDFSRVLRIALSVDDDTLVISELDSLTSGGGTWVAFGDAENVESDTVRFVKGAGSIKFDIDDSGGTTAGIENTGLDTFDMTDYMDNGHAFYWVDLTDKTDVTNLILIITDAGSNTITATATTDHAGNAFVNGMNLIRFNLSTATVGASFDPTTAGQAKLYMTKDAGKVSEKNYRFDWLVLKIGEINYVLYYSKYGWQSSAGTWQENSSATTDLLNADTDEFELIVTKFAEFASAELKEKSDRDTYKAEYNDMKKDYEMKNPSERKILTTEYHRF